MGTRPDTIVLIHGFWVTPRSWEDWITHYEGRGYRVLAPAYPGFEVEVEALNADVSPIEAVTVPQIIEHLEAVVGGLESPPILIGHSAGGVFTQVLLDHGFGAAGVGAINSAPTEGVKRIPLSQNQGDVPGAQEPGQPPQGCRLHVQAVGDTRSPTPSARKSHGGCTSATTSRRPDRFSGAAHSRTSIPAPTSTTSTTKATTARAPLLFISGSNDNNVRARQAYSNPTPSTTNRTPSQR